MHLTDWPSPDDLPDDPDLMTAALLDLAPREVETTIDSLRDHASNGSHVTPIPGRSSGTCTQPASSIVHSGSTTSRAQ